MTKRRLSDAQEREIRKAFFVDKVSPDALIAQWQMSKTMLRRIVGGPLGQKQKGIERFYV